MARHVNKKIIKYLMGTCMPTYKTNAARILVPFHEFDDYLHMHFKKNKIIFAHDPTKLCKVGDTVLLQILPKQMTKLITHKVLKVIFPLGDIIDPITNKKVAGSKYRDDIKETNTLFGESENAFDYEKAPPRGHLEDKNDFTHKPVYKKYYDNPNDPQPFGV